MPYARLDALPDYVQKLPTKKQRQWRDIFNSAHARCIRSGKDTKTCDSLAFANANGVVQVGQAANSATFSGDEQKVAGAATFDLQAAVPAPLLDAGDLVYRRGKLFEVGDFPDKAFSMTAAELAAAVEAFSDPLPLDLEHFPTLLDNNLGELVSVEATDDGRELYGIVALPKWLDDVLPERPVSCTWDRATKTLAGLALVRSPRVSDAALMAAFSAATASEGEQDAAEFAEWDTAYVNDLDDSSFLYIEPGGTKDGSGKTVPRSKRKFPYKDKDGKVDLPHLRNAIARIPQSDAPNKDALQKRARDLLDKANASASDTAADELANTLQTVFAATRHDSPEGQMTLQMIHDTAARGGAVCKAGNVARMASSHESTAIQKVHDLTTEHGATCSSMANGRTMPLFSAPPAPLAKPPQERRASMSFKDRLLAALTLAGIDEDAGSSGGDGGGGTGAEAVATMSGGSGKSEPKGQAEASEMDLLRRQLAAQAAENRRLQAERIQERAVEFANRMIKVEHRATPAEYDKIVAAFVQAATDDSTIGTASFSDGGSRVKLLEDAYAARDKNSLSGESVASTLAEMALLHARQTPSTKDNVTLSQDQVDELLRLTSLGRTALAERNGAKVTGGKN